MKERNRASWTAIVIGIGQLVLAALICWISEQLYTTYQDIGERATKQEHRLSDVEFCISNRIPTQLTGISMQVTTLSKQNMVMLSIMERIDTNLIVVPTFSWNWRERNLARLNMPTNSYADKP